MRRAKQAFLTCGAWTATANRDNGNSNAMTQLVAAKTLLATACALEIGVGIERSPATARRLLTPLKLLKLRYSPNGALRVFERRNGLLQWHHFQTAWSLASELREGQGDSEGAPPIVLEGSAALAQRDVCLRCREHKDPSDKLECCFTYGFERAQSDSFLLKFAGAPHRSTPAASSSCWRSASRKPQPCIWR